MLFYIVHKWSVEEENSVKELYVLKHTYFIYAVIPYGKDIYVASLLAKPTRRVDFR